MLQNQMLFNQFPNPMGNSAGIGSDPGNSFLEQGPSEDPLDDEDLAKEFCSDWTNDKSEEEEVVVVAPKPPPKFKFQKMS